MRTALFILFLVALAVAAATPIRHRAVIPDRAFGTFAELALPSDAVDLRLNAAGTAGVVVFREPVSRGGSTASPSPAASSGPSPLSMVQIVETTTSNLIRARSRTEIEEFDITDTGMPAVFKFNGAPQYVIDSPELGQVVLAIEHDGMVFNFVNVTNVTDADPVANVTVSDFGMFETFTGAPVPNPWQRAFVLASGTTKICQFRFGSVAALWDTDAFFNMASHKTCTDSSSSFLGIAAMAYINSTSVIFLDTDGGSAMLKMATFPGPQEAERTEGVAVTTLHDLGMAKPCQTMTYSPGKGEVFVACESDVRRFKWTGTAVTALQTATLSHQVVNMATSPSGSSLFARLRTGEDPETYRKNALAVVDVDDESVMIIEASGEVGFDVGATFTFFKSSESHVGFVDETSGRFVVIMVHILTDVDRAWIKRPSEAMAPDTYGWGGYMTSRIVPSGTEFQHAPDRWVIDHTATYEAITWKAGFLNGSADVNQTVVVSYEGSTSTSNPYSVYSMADCGYSSCNFNSFRGFVMHQDSQELFYLDGTTLKGIKFTQNWTGGFSMETPRTSSYTSTASGALEIATIHGGTYIAVCAYTTGLYVYRRDTLDLVYNETETLCTSIAELGNVNLVLIARCSGGTDIRDSNMLSGGALPIVQNVPSNNTACASIVRASHRGNAFAIVYDLEFNTGFDYDYGMGGGYTDYYPPYSSPTRPALHFHDATSETPLRPVFTQEIGEIQNVLFASSGMAIFALSHSDSGVGTNGVWHFLLYNTDGDFAPSLVRNHNDFNVAMSIAPGLTNASLIVVDGRQPVKGDDYMGFGETTWGPRASNISYQADVVAVAMVVPSIATSSYTLEQVANLGILVGRTNIVQFNFFETGRLLHPLNRTEVTLETVKFHDLTSGEETDLPSGFTLIRSQLRMSAAPSRDYSGRSLTFSVTVRHFRHGLQSATVSLVVESSLGGTLNADGRVVVRSPASLASITLQLSDPSIGGYVTASFGATAMSYDAAAGRLRAVGAVEDLNLLLRKVRFSYNHNLAANASAAASANSGITLTVDDTVNQAYTQSLTVSNFAVNARPRIVSPLPAVRVKQGKSFQFAINTSAFSDADDTLVFTATPVNASIPWLLFFADRVELSGTASQKVSAEIEVMASDGYLNVTQRFSFTVFNSQPVAHPGNATNQTVQVGSRLEYTLPESAFTDEDDASDTLVLTAMREEPPGSGTFVALPSGINFEHRTRKFTGTMGVNSLIRVQVVASDGFTYPTQTSLSFDINFVNERPQIVNTTGLENPRLKVGVPFLLDTSRLFADSDSPVVTVGTVGFVPSWLSFRSNLFSGTPPLPSSAIKDQGFDFESNFTVTLRASDSYLHEEHTIQFHLYDASPVVTLAFASTRVKVGAFVDIDFSRNISDADFDVLTVSASQVSGSSTTNLPRGLSFDEYTRVLSGTPINEDPTVPSADFNAVYVLRITASDGQLSHSADFVLSIYDSAPQSNLVNGTATRQVKLGQLFSVSFESNFSDPDPGEKLTFTNAPMPPATALPTWILFDTQSARVFGQPTLPDSHDVTMSYASAVTVVVTASDRFLSATGYLVVGLYNTVPVALNPSGIVIKRKLGEPVSELFANNFTDPDGDTLSFLAKSRSGDGRLPTWLGFDSNSKLLSGRPTLPASHTDLSLDYRGSEELTVAVSDGFLEASMTVRIDVSDAAPYAVPLPVTSFGDREAFAARSTTIRFPTMMFRDPDPQDELTLTARTERGQFLPSWIVFDSAQFSFTVTPTRDGIWQLVHITASDGFLQTTAQFNLSVPYNVPPSTNRTGASKLKMQWIMDENNIFTIPSDIFLSPDGDALSLSVEAADGGPLPQWMAFDAGKGVLTGKAGSSELGKYGIRIKATDPLGAAATAYMEVSLERSLIQNILYAAEILGYALSAIGPLAAAYGYRIALMNTHSGRGVIWEEKIFDEDGVHDLSGAGKVETVQAFRREGSGPACIRSCISAISWNVYNNLTLKPLQNGDMLPKYLEYDAVEHKLHIDMALVRPHDIDLHVNVCTAAGLILRVLELHPAELLMDSGNGVAEFSLAKSPTGAQGSVALAEPLLVKPTAATTAEPSSPTGMQLRSEKSVTKAPASPAASTPPPPSPPPPPPPKQEASAAEIDPLEVDPLTDLFGAGASKDPRDDDML